LNWYTERLYRDWQTRYGVRKELLNQRTRFQHIRILQTGRCGRMLVLDDITQTCELDEFIYHEMLVHPLMIAHGRCKRVLIIGGGDGGALREVLRHPVEQAVLVEIDRSVIEACRRYLPTLSADAFDDPRVEMIIADGAKFVRECERTFDALIIDSPDPIGPARALFGTRFYRNVHRLLAPRGFAVRQAGAVILQTRELADAVHRMKRVFEQVRVHLAPVPTYVGGFFSFVTGARPSGLFHVSRKIVAQRIRHLRLSTRYYNADVHHACSALPNYVKETVK